MVSKKVGELFTEFVEDFNFGSELTDFGFHLRRYHSNFWIYLFLAKLVVRDLKKYSKDLKQSFQRISEENCRGDLNNIITLI